MIPTMKRTERVALRAAALVLCGLGLLGCHPDMWNQPRFSAHQQSDFFRDQSAARPRVPGTVPYAGKARAWKSAVFEDNTGRATVPPVTESAFYTGRNSDGSLVADNYFEVDAPLLERGRQRFEVNCIHCHGLLGDGNGVITKRGFPQAATYHIDRLREVEDGYFVDVITNGFGRMYNQASKVAPEDRWAIAAYIRALQLSQGADITDPATPLAKEVEDAMARPAGVPEAPETQHEGDGNAH